MGFAVLIRLSSIIILLACSCCLHVMAVEAADEPFETLRDHVGAEFTDRVAKEWGETVTGVRTRLKTEDKVMALTLDACGSPKGNSIDAALIVFLEKEHIPATLFINARWIDANPELFRK